MLLGEASNRAIAAISVVIASSPLLGQIAGASFPPVAAVVCLFAALLGLTFSHVAVLVVDDSIEIRLGPVGWPRLTLPLDRIRRVTATDLNPMEHGGWGYRGGLRWFGHASVVVRGGESLVIHLDDGSVINVTIDGAAQATRSFNLRERG